MEDDGLPRYMCEKCVSIITEFYNFSVIYEENINQLKALLESKVAEETQEDDAKDVEFVREAETEISNDEGELQVKKEVEDQSNFSDQFLVKAELSDYIEEEQETMNSEETALSDETESTTHSVVNFPQQKTTPRIIENDDGTMYEEKTKYECKSCGDTFLYSSGIASHMYKKHRMQDIDPENYAEKIYLKVKKYPDGTGLGYSHPNIKKQYEKLDVLCPKCIICKQLFGTIDELKEHMAIHKTFVCEVCGNSFIKKSYLDDHREAHGTEKRYKCKFCNKCFKRRTVLVKHKRIHTHPRQCICEVCGKRFNDNGTLKTHRLLLHIKERKFKCMICNQSFPLKPTLDKHIRRHMKRENGEKDFSCDKCDMKYRDKSSLNRHQLTKHSAVDYKVQCVDCGKEYTSTTNLFKHRRIHHKETAMDQSSSGTF